MNVNIIFYGVQSDMNDNKFKEVKDAKWESADINNVGIKFINNRKKFRIRIIIYSIIFVLIAAISGGVSGAYIVKEYYSKTNDSADQSLIGAKNENVQTGHASGVSENSINRISKIVGPTVVGISGDGKKLLNQKIDESGSGIIFDSNGYIVTNYHVIEGDSKVKIRLSGGKILDSNVVGTDQKSDLAVLKINAKNLPAATFGDSSKVKVGDLAVAIGNPFGQEFEGSVTAGIISALNRKIQYGGSTYKVIQTDAAINPGNSGGPLCNEKGEIIGINSLKLGSDQNAQGMGFAISINEVKDIIRSLMSTGKVSRPSLGIYGQSVVSEKNKITGVYIKEVVPGSGAAAAGIKPTDIIIELDKKKIIKFEDISDILDKHKIGDSISCKILRNKKVIQTKIILSDITAKNK